MEYFVYISDSKLEMLYEQISWPMREQLAFDLSIDIGLIKARFSKTAHQSARSTKLKMVETHLSKQTGTMFDPSTYFFGEMEMLWGPYDDYENFVFFGGYEDFLHIGLGGTLTNCLGMPEERERTSSYSLSPYLISVLAKKHEIENPQRHFTNSRSVRELNAQAMEAVVESNYTLALPKQRLKFFAKKIAYGQVQRFGAQTVLIGSPIYVAAAD